MSRLNELGPIEASDHILDLAWSPEGTSLAVTPTTGEILILSEAGKPQARHPGQTLGNARPAWFQGNLVTSGFDGKVHFSQTKVVQPGRGLIERLRPSPDGRYLAAGQGRSLHIFDAEGGDALSLHNLSAGVADFAWNPSNPQEIALVGAGGARMWRLGEKEPFARFDWGGASLLVEWSSCGRWLVTGDQTASVHIYDFSRDYPLHIQGYETKVRAIAFSPDGTQLATGGAPVVTVWPCTGKTGPEGVTPLQLDGHDADVLVAAFSPATGQLATGDETGALLVFTFEEGRVVRKRVRRDAGISALAWHPTKPILGLGQSDGAVSLLVLE